MKIVNSTREQAQESLWMTSNGQINEILQNEIRETEMRATRDGKEIK